jgi:hypothetical protein
MHLHLLTVLATEPLARASSCVSIKKDTGMIRTVCLNAIVVTSTTQCFKYLCAAS